MTVKVKEGQVWKSKETGDKVKVKKLLPAEVKVFDVDGSNYGDQYKIALSKLTTKYRLIKDV